MLTFSFVLLNYNNFKDTDECVISLLNNICYMSYYIIIVDNGSIDSSNKLLEKKYKRFKNIIIINNNNNLGFSKGNNAGFIYAKYKLKSDFICLLNNDTILKQNDFINIVIKKFNTYKFDVLGPNIISMKNNKSTNPQSESGKTVYELNKYIFKLKIYLFLSYFSIDKIFRVILHYIKKRMSKNIDIDYKTERSNVQLHGACLIFSPCYIKRYDGLLEKTFMYMEEDILYEMCRRNKLKIMYTPDLVIYHKEGSTLEKLNNKSYLNRRFYYKNNIKSAKIVKSYLINLGK